MPPAHTAHDGQWKNANHRLRRFLRRYTLRRFFLTGFDDFDVLWLERFEAAIIVEKKKKRQISRISVS